MSPTAPGDHAPFWRYLLDPPYVGELDDADWIGEAGSLGQGEFVRLFARGEGERLTEVRFMAFGCSATLAAAAVLTERLQGLSFAEADAVGAGDVALALGDLRQDQAHGAHLAITALQELLADARNEVLPPRSDKLICSCYRVSESLLRHAIATRQLKTVDQVTAATLAGKGCSSCHGEIRTLLAEARGPKPNFVPQASAPPSLQQRAAKVMDQLDLLRPRLQATGAEVRLVDTVGDRFIFQLNGERAPDGSHDLRRWLETELRQALWPDLTVEVAL